MVDSVTNPSVTVAQAFKRRNLASLRNLAHQTQMAITNMGAMPEAKGADQADGETPEGFPLMIQGLRSNPKDSESHLLFLDTGNTVAVSMDEFQGGGGLVVVMDDDVVEVMDDDVVVDDDIVVDDDGNQNPKQQNHQN